MNQEANKHKSDPPALSENSSDSKSSSTFIPLLAATKKKRKKKRNKASLSPEKKHKQSNSQALNAAQDGDAKANSSAVCPKEFSDERCDILTSDNAKSLVKKDAETIFRKLIDEFYSFNEPEALMLIKKLHENFKDLEAEVKKEADYVYFLNSEIKALKNTILTCKTSAKKKDLKLLESISCSICFEVLAVPHTIECGHSYCFYCLYQWVKNLANQAEDFRSLLKCPCCRIPLVAKPIYSLTISQQVEVIIDEFLNNKYVVKSLSEDYPEKSNVIQRLEERKGKPYFNNDTEKFKSMENPWDDIWPRNTPVIQDLDDNVDRCGVCGWELENGNCISCMGIAGTLDASSDVDLRDEWFDDDDHLSEDGEALLAISAGMIPNFEDRSVDEESELSDGFVVSNNVIEYESSNDEQGLDSSQSSQPNNETNIPKFRRVSTSSGSSEEKDKSVPVIYNRYRSELNRRVGVILSDSDSNPSDIENTFSENNSPGSYSVAGDDGNLTNEFSTSEENSNECERGDSGLFDDYASSGSSISGADLCDMI